MMSERPTAEGEPSSAPAIAHEKPLRESLADSSVLLWYATREGKDVSPETVQHIVAAQSVLNSAVRDPTVEGQFWVAFRNLAMAVRPVSVDSILATYSYPFGDHNRPGGRPGWRGWWRRGSGGRRLVDAATTKKKYSFWSIVVLVCLLVVQIYWFIGTTFRDDLETHRAELDRIAGSLREMAPDLMKAGAMVTRKEGELSAERTHPISQENGMDGIAVTQISEDLDSLNKESPE